MRCVRRDPAFQTRFVTCEVIAAGGYQPLANRDPLEPDHFGYSRRIGPKVSVDKGQSSESELKEKTVGKYGCCQCGQVQAQWRLLVRLVAAISWRTSQRLLVNQLVQSQPLRQHEWRCQRLRWTRFACATQFIDTLVIDQRWWSTWHQLAE